MRKWGTSGMGAGLGGLLLLVGLMVSVDGRAVAAEETPWLGVMMQSLDQGLKDGMNYQGGGVLVARVVEGSAAEQAGIKKGDVIVSVNARAVKSSEDLGGVIRQSRVGQTVSIVVMRDGRRSTLSAKLGARPDDIEIETPDVDGLPPDHLKHLQGLKDLDVEVLPRISLGNDGPLFAFQGMGRGRLGVRSEDLSKDLAPYFSAPEGSGALVIEVMKDTPAEKAGIRAGDVVTQVGGQKVSGPEDLLQAVRKAPQGKVPVTLLRKGVKRTVEAELEAAPGAWQDRGGRGFMVMGPRDRRIVIRHGPGGSDAPPAPGMMRDELRQLREELRQLREKLQKLEDRD